MMSCLKALPAFLLLLICPALPAQDNPECIGKTLGFFTTFDGFIIERCTEAEFGSYKFYLDGQSRFEEKKGKYREVWFTRKPGISREVSGMQIIQNHVNAIKAVKGEVLKGSDDGIYRTYYNGNELWIHLTVYAGNKNVDNFAIKSIEVQAMKQEVTAVGIKGAITSLGKVALYGILFDTGKSDIKSESAGELKEVAVFLKDNPEVSVYIVGHTDNVGSSQTNIALSKSRGEAVKKYLVSAHGIDPNRLSGEGAGSLCPVASNETEDGRKLNRRVEIVKK